MSILQEAFMRRLPRPKYLQIVSADFTASDRGLRADLRQTEALAMTADLQLIRVRLLNALGCLPGVLQLLTTIAAYVFGRDSARLGLEPLSELLGHPGQPQFAKRALNASAEWQKRSGV